MGPRIVAVAVACLVAVASARRHGHSPGVTIHSNDYDALVKFYHDTGGPHWKKSKGWLENDNPCDPGWHGVWCKRDGPNKGRVWKLMLPRNNLVGDIHWDHLYRMVDTLEYINLARNPGLGGEIDERLGHFTQLTHLNLHDNRLTGTLSPELGNLVELKTLHLTGNQLEGTLPTDALAKLTKLEAFNVHTNRLEGKLPDDFGSTMPKLKYVTLHQNNFENVPEAFALAKDLKYIEAEPGWIGCVPIKLAWKCWFRTQNNPDAVKCRGINRNRVCGSVGRRWNPEGRRAHVHIDAHGIKHEHLMHLQSKGEL